MSTESELRDWRNGPIAAERLCAEILTICGYTDVDPQAPLGGPDGKKDIVAMRDGVKHVAAVYFPPTPPTFREIQLKFESDYEGVERNLAGAFVFFVNQHLTVEERRKLRESVPLPAEVFHLERIRLQLDSPRGYGFRLAHLGIQMTAEDQLSFFSQLQRDNERRMRANERTVDALAQEVRRTRDVVARTTLAAGAVLLAGSSSLTGSDPTLKFEIPMSDLNVTTFALIHRLVMDAEGDATSVAEAGQLRAIQVFIGDPQDPIYAPPAPEDVPRLLAELAEWWRGAYPELAIAPQAEVVEGLARLHHTFLSIHPFMDGNGRVARVLVDQAAQELLGQRIGRELVANHDAYFETLRAADRGDLTPLMSLLGAALS